MTAHRARVVLAVCAAVAALSTLALAPSGAEPIRLPEFVANCTLSHRAPDDPIVFPGRPGAAHMHDFYGNRSTRASSTATSLRRGKTTCHPRADRAAYWFPTLYLNGKAVRPRTATFYYSTSIEDPAKVRSLPQGLRIIAGDSHATKPVHPIVAEWACLGAGTESSPTMVTCPDGADLELHLRFPDCWNGRDLDSPDHRSHMAYSKADRCPKSHPVPVAQLQFKLHYPIAGGKGVRLSSGPGYTAHGDFINTWDQDELARRVRNCLRRVIKCGTDGKPVR
ncbi:MAG: hypothetical protein QOE06_536 [Thermoleophilaceae bacterium]|jgi:hypothetical protein|nr:hypothetical protein [Thermoleophilaceae bacterium]